MPEQFISHLLERSQIIRSDQYGDAIYQAYVFPKEKQVVVKRIVSSGYASKFQKTDEYSFYQDIAGLSKNSMLVSPMAWDIDNNAVYLVMPYIEGTDLIDVVNTERTEPERLQLAITYSRDIGTALNTMRQLGYVHNDLDLAQIRVDQEEKMHLLDFFLVTKGVTPRLVYIKHIDIVTNILLSKSDALFSGAEATVLNAVIEERIDRSHELYPYRVYRYEEKARKKAEAILEEYRLRCCNGYPMLPFSAPHWQYTFERRLARIRGTYGAELERTFLNFLTLTLNNPSEFNFLEFSDAIQNLNNKVD